MACAVLGELGAMAAGRKRPIEVLDISEVAKGVFSRAEEILQHEGYFYARCGCP